MRRAFNFSFAALVTLTGSCSLAMAADATIATGLTYVCAGEHMYVESCNIRDLSDNSNCLVVHLDKKLPNGNPTRDYESRGSLKKLLPTCQQPPAQAIAKMQAAQKKQEDAYKAMMNPPRPVAPANPPQAMQQGGPFNGSVRPLSGESLREGRCVVSGRNPNLCGENALGSWFQGAITNGINIASAVQPGAADLLSKATKTLPPGLEISGNYVGAGNWDLQFDDRSAMMSCGGLAPQQRFYTIGIFNGQAVIKLEMTPKPLVLFMRPDGTLADAGPVVVNGVVIAGAGSSTTSAGKWVNSQNTTTQVLTPMEAQQYAGDPNLHNEGESRYTLNRTTNSTTYQPGTTTYSGPSYAPKTETCSQALLRNSGKTQTDALKGIAENMLLGGQTPTGPAGLRMHGAYIASTGLSVEFFPESAILGCGQTIKAYSYVLQGGSVRVDAPKPLVMAIKPDNTLDPGSGSYEVQGKRLLGKTQGGDFAAAPSSQTCSLAVLRPGTIGGK